MTVLILCTGNSCRSQMAESMLRQLRPDLDVYSAGVKPETEVSPFAMQVLREHGYETAGLSPKSIQLFDAMPMDVVLTVCDDANEECPTFPASRLHLHDSFEDPYPLLASFDESHALYEHVRQGLERWLSRVVIPNIDSLKAETQEV